MRRLLTILFVLLGLAGVRAQYGLGVVVSNTFPEPLDHGPYLDFAYETSNTLATLALAKPDEANRKLYELDGYTVDTDCWAYGLPWSCFIHGYKADKDWHGNIVLITQRHGITAKHFFAGTWPTNVIVKGQDGLAYTNYASITADNPTNDLRLLSFPTNWPTAVVPAYVLASNYLSYLTNYTTTNSPNLAVMWFRNNTTNLNTRPIFVNSNSSYASLRYDVEELTGVPFHEEMTGGDSSGPVFFVNGTNLVFGCSLYTATASPFVSYSNNLAWIQSNIGTNTLKFVDMYPFYPYNE